ncbi:MAG: class I SAM-dependent methyltransferase [Anaerolineales bacterium]|uniref:class I SAM-dependent rRNA methyltransferase n=1 Tax=Candidatus Villigracilis vicinus TaxID=3140679 RepID=UPI0031362E4F|nr:class I SAM-dependent methyltransferase [Anaerolineales bacterium]
MTEILPALSQLPSPSTQRIALRITAPAERALKQGHPWIFDQSITEQSHKGAPGDLAVIFDDKRRFLGVGLYDPTSPIRVRVLQKIKPATIDNNWFHEKIKTADAIRAPLRKQETDGYRLIHGENDGLPGLVIDRYAETFVLKLYTPAWVPHLKDVCAALQQTQHFDHLILRLSRTLNKQADELHGLTDGMTLTASPDKGQTPEGLVLFKENGLTFECDPINGQKTGFFLDQRENRERVRDMSEGKSVLNVFSYTGGFSLYAADGGATEVVSVDFSTPATQATLRNIQHNQNKPNVKNAKFETLDQDAFEALMQMKAEKRQFDIVILDPPMFAQNQSQVETALAAYRRLTHLGLDVLKRGGILVQASCSSRVSTVEFFDAIHRSARETGRPLEEIERTGHALDHPITYKEGAYLKCLFATAP